MKRILMVLATSAALSAWGQAVQQAPKAASSTDANSGKSASVYLQDADGRAHELAVPLTLNQVQGLVQSSAPVDLRNMQSNQTGCPVQILQASFERPAQFMLTSHSSASESPALHLEYQNSSGKDIASVLLTGWIKVKQGPYQLDATNRPIRLELSRTALLGQNVQAAQALKLVSDAIGFDRIELSQVSYADGTTWSPENRSCVYANNGSTERAKAW